MGGVKGASAPFLLRRSGRLCISQSISGGAGGSPLRPLAGVGALAGAPPRPRNSILRRPRRQRRGAPARRLAGVGGLRLAAAALIQWGGGAAAARPLWVVPLSPVCAVLPACVGAAAWPWRAGRLGRLLRCTLSRPARPAPAAAPVRLRARGWGSAGCGQRGRPARSRGRVKWPHHITSPRAFPYKQHTICRSRDRLLTMNHKKLVTSVVLSQETCYAVRRRVGDSTMKGGV